MKTLLLLCLLVSCTALARSPVAVTVADAKASGPVIPADFIGLSFDTESLLYDHAGVEGYLFDSTNRQLLTLFQNLGIRNLRIGGDTVDDPGVPISKPADIDALFRFAEAAGVKVIYSLRLQNGDPLQDASIAKYIWEHHREHLECFSIGNEPNLYKEKDPEITDYSTFHRKWKRFAEAIVDSVPEAKFGGPDNGTGGKNWAFNLARDEKRFGNLAFIFSHFYVGGYPKGATAQQLIDGMLSPGWTTDKYPEYFDALRSMEDSTRLPYRLTESNSYVTGYPGVWGGHNSFATALYALDYMHWWAAHDCQGVNFHTRQWKYNGTLSRDADGGYGIYPMGYGIKAFEVGGRGRVYPVTIGNPDGLNLTAYAASDADALYVTIINKEHGAGGRGAEVSISTDGLFATKSGGGRTNGAAIMYLTAPDNDVAATSGITLGGAMIDGAGMWSGRWTPLAAAGADHHEIEVPVASAVIVKVELAPKG